MEKLYKRLVEVIPRFAKKIVTEIVNQLLLEEMIRFKSGGMETIVGKRIISPTKGITVFEKPTSVGIREVR